MPHELIGDSARGEAYALARLVVENDRIVEADAPGMSRPLAGLTLLEAAPGRGERPRAVCPVRGGPPVRGERLAADPAPNALAPAVRAAPRPGRAAVAMSGGVD